MGRLRGKRGAEFTAGMIAPDAQVGSDQRLVFSNVAVS